MGERARPYPYDGAVVRVLFFGTPEFALPALEALHGASPYQVVAVVTRPDRPAGRGRAMRPPSVKERALALGLPVLQPPTLRAPEAVAALRALAPEAGVLAAYGQIVPLEVLALPPRGILNIHPSLLPRHRGASPVAAAILAGDQETGVTLFQLNEGLDSGPIIAQRRRPIDDRDTTGTLTAALARDGADLLLEALPRWLDGSLPATPQDQSQVTYAPRITAEEARLDWGRPAAELWRRVRAFSPWPGAFCPLRGRRLRVWEAWPLSDRRGGPGRVLALERLTTGPEGVRGCEVIVVGTGQGALALLQVQREGKRTLPAGEFARGERGLLGASLA